MRRLNAIDALMLQLDQGSAYNHTLKIRRRTPKVRRVGRPLIASMAVSTRGAEDDKPSNTAALAQVELGAPDATPAQRLEQIIASTATLKAGVRAMAPGVLERESSSSSAPPSCGRSFRCGGGSCPRLRTCSCRTSRAGPRTRST